MLKTPVYVIDERILRQNLEIFKSVKDQTQCSIILALKAYSTYATFPLMKDYLDGCTSSSLNEAILAHEEFGKSVHIYSPGFTHEVMDPITDVASHIIFNSHSQMETFKPVITSKKTDIQVGLRLNPEHSEVKTSLYNPCAPCSRFGVTKKELDMTKLDGVDGVLVHALCGHGADALERLMKSVEDKFSEVLQQVKWVDFGGGHMVTRPDYDRDLLVTLINTFQDKYDVQVILEPGEAMVVNAGVLETTVVDILRNDMDIAILDTSATAHMPDVLEMPYRPTVQDAGNPNEKAHTYRLGSTTCLSGDVIGDYSFDHPLQIGDRVIFEDMAQYTMVKNTTFNGVDLPNIAVKRESGEIELIKEFGYDDFKRRV